MNFNGSGGLMLLVVAGLWLWVFVPSWFKRSEGRQEVRRTKREKPKSSGVVKTRSKLYTEAAFDLRAAGKSEVALEDNSRAWQPNSLPAPAQRIGELEVAVLADVVALPIRKVSVPAKSLESAELDAILRRRRANG
jgi:hypothetical protein